MSSVMSFTVTAPADGTVPLACHNRSVPLHPQAQAVLAMMAELGEPPLELCTPDEARAMRARRQRPPTEPIHETRDLDADGVPVRLYRPSDASGLGLLVYLHGGGWVIGSRDTHDNVCRILANAS